MGKRINKWLQKREKARLAKGWKPESKLCPKEDLVGVKAGEIVFKTINISRVFRCGVMAAFQPKPVAVDKNPFSSAEAFGARLNKRGYVRLGSGCFSTVYAKGDSDRVIKVTRRIDNWIDYIHWASENGYAGKGAPKVFSYKKYTGSDGELFSVAIVERMEQGYGSVNYKDDAYIAQALLWPAMSGNTMAQVYLDDFQPGLPKFLLDFKKKFGKSGTDIGGNNMMIRKDGSFCLTDPLCGKSEIEVKRLRSRDFLSLAPANQGLFYERYKEYWFNS